MSDSFLDIIKQLIVQDKIDQAIDKCIQFHPQNEIDILKSLIILRNNYNRLQLERTSGFYSLSEYQVDLNLIIDRLWTIALQINDVLIQKLSTGKMEGPEFIKANSSTPQAFFNPNWITNYPRIDLNKQFFGRKENLSLIKSKFDNKAIAVCIWGMGGVGKTTLARAYVATYSVEYRNIIWLDFSGTLVKTFVANDLLTQNLIHLGSNTNQGDLDKFQLILNELRKFRKLLLVIDNVTNEQEILKLDQHLPPDSHLLITSRLTFYNYFQVHQLGSLSETASINLFRSIYPITKEEDAIREIVQLLYFLPLLIEIKAVFAKKNNLSLSQLKDRIRSGVLFKDRVSINISHNRLREIGNIKNYLNSIFKNSNLSNFQKQILYCFTFLPAQYIEESIVKELLADLELMNEGMSMQRALQSLHSSSWLEKTENKYRLHSLIREILIEDGQTAYIEYLFLIANQINQIIETYSDDQISIRLKWMPYIKHLLNLTPLDQRTKIVNLLFKYAELNRIVKDLQTAVIYHKEVSKLCGDSIHLRGLQVRSTHSLASIYRYEKKYQKAQTTLEDFMKAIERNQGINHKSYANSQYQLALVKIDQGDYPQADHLLVDAMAWFKMNHTEENKNEFDKLIFATQSNLIKIRQLLGRYQEVIPLMEEASQLAEKIWGADHKNYIRIQAFIASSKKNLNEVKPALQLFKRCYEWARSNLSPNEPLLAMHIADYAAILAETGELSKAITLYQKSIEIDRLNFGEKDPHYAYKLGNLGALYHQNQKLKKAQETLEQTLNLQTELLGIKHPDTMITMANLAKVIYHNPDQIKRAIHLIEFSIQKGIEVLGKSHPVIGIRLGTLGTIHEKNGDPKSAEKYWKQAISTLVKLYPANHPTIAKLQQKLNRLNGF